MGIILPGRHHLHEGFCAEEHAISAAAVGRLYDERDADVFELQDVLGGAAFIEKGENDRIGNVYPVGDELEVHRGLIAGDFGITGVVYKGDVLLYEAVDERREFLARVRRPVEKDAEGDLAGGR